jgi:pSer/pThr/pTyr-binding forkhead associated (FHA) protein
MPKLTLVVERRVLKVYDIDRPTIKIGREIGQDVVIDNVAVSRHQAEIRLVDMQWVVKDLESGNGTFLNGKKLAGVEPIKRGDEISFGKFSVFFDHVPAEAVPPPKVDAPKAAPAHAEPGRTLVMKPEELAKLRQTIVEKRKAHLRWQAGKTEGNFPLSDGPVVVGRDDLCDLRVTCRAPKHHLIIRREGQQFEARNLSWWYRMRVNGEPTKRATLKNGDEIAIGGLRLTFMDEVR